MKRVNKLQPAKALTKPAVLLIPEPEHAGEPPSHGIKPGYYDAEQLLELLDRHKCNAAAIHYIADMLETGNPKDDEFAQLLRAHHGDPTAIARIVKAAGS
jgi:hypothetical protein